MNAVTAVVRWIDQIVIVRVPDDLLEVDHRVEVCSVPDPVVDRVPDGCLRWIPTGVVVRRCDIVPGNDRDPDHLEPGRFEPFDDLLQASDHLVTAGIAPDVV